MPTKTKAEPVLDAEDTEILSCEAPVDEIDENEAGDESPERITGQDLLDFHAAQKEQGLAHADIAYNAGYYSVTKTGQERVMVAQFNAALLSAQGVDVGGTKSTGGGRNHAGLSKARVSGQGIALVSQLATREVGAVPGAVFSVEYPQGALRGPGAQILLTLTDEVKPVVARKAKEAAEEPGTPLLD